MTQTERDKRFEWDAAKDAANLEKHGMTLRYAAQVFATVDVVSTPAGTKGGEERFVAVGNVEGIIAVIWTPRRDVVRLISARRANRRERDLWQQSTTPQPKSQR